MILKTLWIQRICNYEGEYAPRCLLAMDEYGFDENPEWFDRQMEKELKDCGNEVDSHKIIDIEVNQEQIAKILDDIPTIEGDIKNEN